jgi:hypothetical protein
MFQRKAKREDLAVAICKWVAAFVVSRNCGDEFWGGVKILARNWVL